ncbi:MAG: RecT family recombinase [Bacteroidota bacterium]
MENKLELTEKKPNAPIAIWKQALIKAESKFMAISGKEEQTKIELGFASMIIQNNDALKKCDIDSIVNAVINVARTGITLNPVLKLAHLVPRAGKCVLDFDYKGLVKVLKDNKCLKDIQAIIVYEDEDFKESNSQIIAHSHTKVYAHTEDAHKKRIVKGVYCQVLLMDNTVIYTQFMPYWEILKTEKVSMAAGTSYSPWKTWREEMIKKTKIKRDFKTLISGSPPDSLVNVLEIEEKNNGLQKKYCVEDEFQDAEVMKSEIKDKKENLKISEKLDLP